MAEDESNLPETFSVNFEKGTSHTHTHKHTRRAQPKFFQGNQGKINEFKSLSNHESVFLFLFVIYCSSTPIVK